MVEQRKIAYFSMEVALDSDMPTYSGGLGILAGDTIRSAADLNVSMVVVTLLHRKGYFYQRLDPDGWQQEEPVEWAINDFLEEMPQRTSVKLEDRIVQLRSWKYEVRGVGEHTVPVFLLDSDLPENAFWDRTLTHFLYGGDSYYRLCQEVIFGIGGVKMLRAIGYSDIKRFHMNEGHASLLTLALVDELVKKRKRKEITLNDIERVREKCIFTTHTPVSAGHDQFQMDMVTRVLGHRTVFEMPDVFCCGGALNMTYLALNLSRYVNGVAKRHGEISQMMFSGYSIDAITNGVHAATWVSEPFQKLFDRHIKSWRHDNFSLRYALNIPKKEIWKIHSDAKKQLLHQVNREANIGMDADVLTIGFARRAAAYKRGDLLFADMERIKSIAKNAGPFQVVYAGKAHPQDNEGKEMIKRIFQAKELLKEDIKIAYLKNYDMNLAKIITSGVDVWLNTPHPPMEASGTSGMKAALNGVPSLSILDGWWLEGHIEGVTGWSFGKHAWRAEESNNRSGDAASLYEKLEQVVIPLFYRRKMQFIEVMRHAIALNGSFFNTHRMVQQYVLKAYF
jgi:starch phosphorylase